MRTEIPLLQNVRVASPCHASWDAMRPIDAERVRFCEHCQKRVYNLSAMGQAEAEGLLRAHEGHLCVRYYRRQDGTILTTDCPVGLRAARQLVLTRTRASLGLCLLLCIALAAHHATTRTMGRPMDVAASPDPAPQVPSTSGWVAGGLPAVAEHKEPAHNTMRMGKVKLVMGELPFSSDPLQNATSPERKHHP